MSAIDPITLEVVRGYFVSTVFQMRATLLRTAYAPILYETHDFSCGLLSPTGELVGMSEDVAGHVFAMSLGLDAVLDKFRDDVRPGDVLAVNDPYTGGTHMNDTAFYFPYFVDGEILMFIAVRAHFADVGGATPGSFSGQDTEIYQEGMRIVPVKLMDEGRLNQGLWDVLFANMRLRDEREGDALAMLDTARVAEASIDVLCDKYGAATIEQCMKILLDNAEQAARDRISELPAGDYYYEHYMDNGGLSPEPLPIKVKLTVDGDAMTLDFTGTAPQVHGPMNCGIPVTRGGTFVIVKSWLDPKTPVNGGTFRPLNFVIPEGSCLAAQLPAAVGGCWDVYRNLQTAVIGVFTQVMPHDLGGENPGGVNHVYVAGYDQERNKPYILYEYPRRRQPRQQRHRRRHRDALLRPRRHPERLPRRERRAAAAAAGGVPPDEERRRRRRLSQKRLWRSAQGQGLDGGQPAQRHDRPGRDTPVGSGRRLARQPQLLHRPAERQGDRAVLDPVQGQVLPPRVRRRSAHADHGGRRRGRPSRQGRREGLRGGPRGIRIPQEGA